MRENKKKSWELEGATKTPKLTGEDRWQTGEEGCDWHGGCRGEHGLVRKRKELTGENWLSIPVLKESLHLYGI